jgi:hypothetical protein
MVGLVSLAERVQAGGGGATDFQLMLMLAGMLVPPLLEAVTEYETVPAVIVVATQLADALEQPLQL